MESKLEVVESLLPNTNKPVVVVLSGGLDSSVITTVLSQYYGEVHAISFDYGQKQAIELQKAAKLCNYLDIPHKIFDLSVFGEIVKPATANIQGSNIEMPTIQDVLGDPAPKTFIPNRNMVMFSLAAAYAEVIGANYIFTGVQSNDTYSYHDTTPQWIKKYNDLLSENRKHPISIIDPLSTFNKEDEIKLLKEIEKEYLVEYTITCYNPNGLGESCGKCPSCAERIQAFIKCGMIDPIPYQIEINWDKYFNRT